MGIFTKTVAKNYNNSQKDSTKSARSAYLLQIWDQMNTEQKFKFFQDKKKHLNISATLYLVDCALCIDWSYIQDRGFYVHVSVVLVWNLSLYTREFFDEKN